MIALVLGPVSCVVVAIDSYRFLFYLVLLETYTVLKYRAFMMIFYS